MLVRNFKKKKILNKIVEIVKKPQTLIISAISFYFWFYICFQTLDRIEFTTVDPQVSIVIPIYREKNNLKELCESISDSILKSNFSSEVILVDDNSSDGSVEVVEDLVRRGYKIKILVRKHERGLSSAVVAGFEIAQHNILLVMDGDLSHPPNKIIELLEPIYSKKADFVIASRYILGGGIKNWPLKRRIISWGATILARPLTNVSDPMSGFFALRRSLYLKARKKLNPSGFKIGLELIIKAQPKSIMQIPYVFSDRTVGQSKLKFKVQLLYLIQLFQLFFYKYPLYSFISFFIVFFAIFKLKHLFFWRKPPNHSGEHFYTVKCFKKNRIL